MWRRVTDNQANTTLASSPLLVLEYLDLLSASAPMCHRYQITVAHFEEQHHRLFLRMAL